MAEEGHGGADILGVVMETGCVHLVEIHLNARTRRFEAVCPALGEGAPGELTRAFMTAYPDLERAGAAVVGWALQAGMGRVAVVFREPDVFNDGSDRRRFDVPGPLGTPFEPVELREREARLRALAGLIPGLAVDEPPRRWRERVVVDFSTLWIFGFVFSMVVGDVMRDLLGGRVQWMNLFWMSVLLAACMAGLLVYMRRPVWLVVPGGILVRSSDWLARPTELARYTAADTTLMIVESGRGIELRLHQGATRLRRDVTALECVVLLAAWQQLAVVPAADALVDLRTRVKSHRRLPILAVWTGCHIKLT